MKRLVRMRYYRAALLNEISQYLVKYHCDFETTRNNVITLLLTDPVYYAAQNIIRFIYSTKHDITF